MKEETKYLYKTLAQTESLTVTVKTKIECTAEQSEHDVKEYIFAAGTENFKKLVTLPMCTQKQWDDGHVNYCPRCGYHLSEWDHDSVENTYFNECPECYAKLDIMITVHKD